MPTFTMTKNWSDASVPTESQLDDIKVSIETFLNVTKLDSNNIQSSSVATAHYGAGSVNAAALATSAVTTAKITDGAVTKSKLAALGQVISNSSGTFSTTSTSYTDVTNLSCTITTTGRPVMIMCIPDGAGTSQIIAEGTSTNVNPGITFKFLRGSTDIAIYRHLLLTASVYTRGSLTYPVNCLAFIETPSAGTYTYKLQIKADSSTTAHLTYTKLFVCEL